MAPIACRVCGGTVNEFIDFGRQPLADSFVEPGSIGEEFRYNMAVGMCGTCTMVQLMQTAPHEQMFHHSYPYRSSGSTLMRAHFEAVARHFLDTELITPGAFIVELGSNDGAMLNTVKKAGVRHLGFEPCGAVAEEAQAEGIRVTSKFFDQESAAEVLAADGPADVIFAANTFSHISFIDSVLIGAHDLLKPGGVFVFEDPYFADIIERTSFDQIYDEHVFFFTARSIREMAHRYGFELVDVERLSVHGGEVRYTLAHAGARPPTPAVARIIAAENTGRLAEASTLDAFVSRVGRIRTDLVDLLVDLRHRGKRVVGYGATAKSSTILNYCGIGADLISEVYDNTPEKQGLLTPGSHVPVRAPSEFATPYPDFAVLFAWNHANEIMEKESAFRIAGGRWITYTPVVAIA